VGRIYIDGGTLDEVEEVILKERRHISEDGIVIPILAINEHTGLLETLRKLFRVVLFPQRGPGTGGERAGSHHADIEKSNLEEVADWGVIKEKIRTALRGTLTKKQEKTVDIASDHGSVAFLRVGSHANKAYHSQLQTFRRGRN